MPCTHLLLLTACAAGFLASASSQDVPAGPNQHCRDDAGPAWGDLEKPYFLKTPATPVLNNGACPSPLAEACADKGIKYAHLASVPQCGGKGWFCRIMDQPGWENKEYGDRNFEHCNVTEADEKDQGGHCHGSDTDNVYGWWVRDHWMRGYPGTLHCCCDWGAVKGVVNRCDYRKPITSASAQRNCRDANEEHNKGYEGSCGAYKKSHPFNDPVDSNPDQCWTVVNFANPESITSNSKAPNYDDKNDFPTTAPGQPPSPPSPTPAPPAPEPETSSVCGIDQKAALGYCICLLLASW